MKRSGLALIAAFLLTSCDQISGAATIKQQVSDAFRDPSSVQFRKVEKCPTGEGWQGEVNGKNGFGAYAGFQSFMADGSKLWISGANTETQSDTAGQSDFKYLLAVCYDKKAASTAAQDRAAAANSTGDANRALANANGALAESADDLDNSVDALRKSGTQRAPR